MKPRYKLDTFVKFSRNSIEDSGLITGQITRNDGIFYEIGTDSVVIAETDIIQAYKPIAERQKKAAKNTSKSAKNNKKEKTESAPAVQ